MNKKELYRKLVEEITIIDVNRFSYSDSFRAGEAAGKIKGLESAKKLLNQLDEPDSTVEYRKGYEQGVLNAIQTANESKSVEIPQFVADYLSNVDVYSFEERIEILVNSHSGDSYYFHEMLPKDGHISYELGDKLYEYSQNENLKKLFQLINGYTIEKEKLYRVKMPNETFLIQSIVDVIGYEHWFNKNFEMYDNVKFQFTEQEIKAIDERYWSFAEEVTSK